MENQKIIYVNNIQRGDLVYTTGSVFLTLVIGVSIFVVALAINDVAQMYFERKECKEGEIHLAIKYTFIVSISAIILVFLAMYFIPGTKW